MVPSSRKQKKKADLCVVCVCRVQKLMNLVPRTLIWPLKDRKPLKSWMHEAGKVTLLGDACHPMLVR